MTGKQHIKKRDTLKIKRRPVETHWKDAFNATYPLLGSTLENYGLDSVVSAGQDKNKKIYDSTLRNSARLLASSYVSGLTPSNSEWFGVSLKGLPSGSAGQKWLDKASTTVWEGIHDSDFDNTAFLCKLVYVIAGMFVMFIEEGDDEGNIYKFKKWPLFSCYFDDSDGDWKIDTVYRDFELEAGQAVKQLSQAKDKLSEKIKQLAEKKPEEKVKFVRCIYPVNQMIGNQRMSHIGEIVEEDTKKLVRKTFYPEQPFIVPRNIPIDNSVYSLGQVNDALPDHNTLNEVIKLVLTNADMAIAGMWGALDDGVLNFKTITVGPRKVIMMASKDSFFPLTSSAKFDVAALEIDRLQRTIKEVMMSDQLHPENGPKMTATEIHLRAQLIRQILGPMYGRMQAEYLRPLIVRCFGIAYRKGLLGEAPQEIEGSLSKIIFKSPMAKAQKLEEISAIDRFEERLITYAEKGLANALDIYDMDKALRRRADLDSVPLDLLIDEKKVKSLRDFREQKIKEQRQQEMKDQMKTDIVKGAVKDGSRKTA